MSKYRNTQGVLGTPQGARIVLLLVTFVLVMLGIVMVYSAGSIEALRDDVSPLSTYLIKPIVFTLFGAAIGFVVWKIIPYQAWRGPLLWAVWGFSLVLLILTAVMGTAELGAQRWLLIGPIGLQPSEFAKITFIMMAVHQFALLREGQATAKDFLVRLFVLIIIPLVFLYKTQSDLGTTLIIAVGLLAVIWLGEIPRKWFFIIVAAVAIFGVMSIFGEDYRSDRFAYLDPWNDGENGFGNGYQIIRSYFSIADGGIFGVGLGNSRGKYAYLPEAETDFIYAVVCEELGMIGGLVVIALFVIILLAGMAISSQSVDSFGTMLAGGLIVMLVFQAFLNIGCVVGIFPITGKPLPFVSSGGSSLMASLIMVGLILSVSEGAGARDVYERRRADLRVVRGASRGESDVRGGVRPQANRSRYISGSGRR